MSSLACYWSVPIFTGHIELVIAQYTQGENYEAPTGLGDELGWDM